jgi:hypothetical protein
MTDKPIERGITMPEFLEEAVRKHLVDTGCLDEEDSGFVAIRYVPNSTQRIQSDFRLRVC